MSDIYNDVRKTIAKYCTDFITSQGLENFQSFEFDAHAATGKLPAKNLLGLAEFSAVNADRLYEFNFMLVVCTLSTDDNNKTLNDVIGRLFDKLRPGLIFRAIDSEAGNVVGHLTVCDNVEVTPVAATEGRPLQALALQVKCSFIVPP